MQRNTVASTARSRHRGEIEIDEIEFLREREILGQQAIRRMRLLRIINERIAFAETRLLDRGILKLFPFAVAIYFNVARRGIDEKAISQRRDERLFAVQMHTNLVQREGRQIELRRSGFEGDGDQRCGVPRQDRRARCRCNRRVLRLDNPERRQHDVIRVAKAALHAANRPGLQLGPTLDRGRPGELAKRLPWVELGDRTRGKRPQVVRIKYFQQRFRELGVIVVELLVDACPKQRERLDHALDVRVLRVLARHGETRCDLRIPFSEVARITSQERQLALVIRQQFFHCSNPRLRVLHGCCLAEKPDDTLRFAAQGALQSFARERVTEYCNVDGSNMASKLTGSSAGCTINTARIAKLSALVDCSFSSSFTDTCCKRGSCRAMACWIDWQINTRS